LSTYKEVTMTSVDAAGRTIARVSEPYPLDEAQLAAVAFLARYSGRTLDAYRHDLRNLFQWATDHGLAVLEATRAHLELYRASMEDRGLAAATIDRRLCTACGFYRLAHIDGRISSKPAHYVRRPTVHPSERRGLDRAELGRFLFTAERFDHAHAALAVLLGLNGLRVSEACGANIEATAFEQGHRVLRITGKGNKAALIPLVPRTARTIDLAVGERRDGPILVRHDGQRLDRRTAHRWVRSIGKRAGIGLVRPHMLRAAFIMAALDAGVPLREVQVAARHADPRTTTVSDCPIAAPPRLRPPRGLRRRGLRCRGLTKSTHCLGRLPTEAPLGGTYGARVRTLGDACYGTPQLAWLLTPWSRVQTIPRHHRMADQCASAQGTGRLTSGLVCKADTTALSSPGPTNICFHLSGPIWSGRLFLSHN
jgi:integrase/recombinase XerD